ncbi:MAG: hypothetical protein AB8I08_24280 [Sandaracinaceae bacterium]
MSRPCLLTFLLLAASAPSAASACAPCESGDPTLSVMGAATPYAGRVRAGSLLRVGWQTETSEGRTTQRTQADLSLALAVSPLDWLTLAVDAPLTLVDVTRADLSASTTLGPGDVTFRARALLLRDRRWQPEHRLFVTLGMRAPTSVDQTDALGALLPYDAQTGSGAAAPLAGVSYGFSGEWSSLLLRGQVHWPVARRYGLTPGPSAQLVAAPQFSVTPWLALRGAVGLRVDAPARIDGQAALDGAVTFSATPQVLLRPESDWLIRVGAQLPLVQTHANVGLTEGAAVFVGVSADLGGAS